MTPGDQTTHSGPVRKITLLVVTCTLCSAGTEGVYHNLALVVADVHPICTHVVHQLAYEILPPTVAAC